MFFMCHFDVRFQTFFIFRDNKTVVIIVYIFPELYFTSVLSRLSFHFCFRATMVSNYKSLKFNLTPCPHRIRNREKSAFEREQANLPSRSITLRIPSPAGPKTDIFGLRMNAPSQSAPLNFCTHSRDHSLLQ